MEQINEEDELGSEVTPQGINEMKWKPKKLIIKGKNRTIEISPVSDGSPINTADKTKNPFKINIVRGEQLSLVNSENESNDGLSLNSCSKLSQDSLASSSEIETISVTGVIKKRSGKVNSQSDDISSK